jgi:hypothetical protein
MAFEIDDRVVVNENSYWDYVIGKHGLVRSVDNPDSGHPPGRGIEVYIDGMRGGNLYFSEDMLEHEVS